MDTNFYIYTSAGIISRDAVTFVQTEIKGIVRIYVIGREQPIVLNELEGSIFLKLLEPAFSIVQQFESEDAQTS